MTTDLTHRLAIYPMVEEADAVGVVAAVYGRILSRMPLVPSLFKSFAVCPAYLVLAWRQADAVFDRDDFGDGAARLRASVAREVTPPPDVEVRDTVGRFVAPLARMLLLSAGLHLALDGELETASADAAPPTAVDAVAEHPAPSQWQADAADVFGRIRRALQTPIINSIWRELAGQGQLEHAWSHLELQVPAALQAADRLQAAALDAARAMQWPVVADADALRRAGVGDAAAGIASILDAYIKTLPRVLVLAASSAE
ncbi:MAG: halocarboxylic acid dehydrogenase DehI family protein [Actinobacteria bacterium]|nr:halocarboxylic acid dehydrogenase DehI family protein [Actinomycetota bacterium]